MDATKFITVDDYINSFPQEVQKTLSQLRSLVHQEIPDIEESIRYNMPTFSINGKYVIYFAAWKKHISLYPFTDQMAKELPESRSFITSGKGTIQLPLDIPLPVDLIQRIIAIRLLENQNSDSK